MFNNIGKKIKGPAKLVCRLGIIACVIIGIIMIVAAVKSGNVPGAISGDVVIVVGFLTSWIGSFFAYGFGELIDKTAEIAENTKK